jgi:hypothetical protein
LSSPLLGEFSNNFSKIYARFFGGFGVIYGFEGGVPLTIDKKPDLLYIDE